MHPGDLAGQSVVVTGAAGELGSTIARRLLHQGAVVVCVDRDAEALDKLEATFVDCSTAHYICTDVSSPEGVGRTESYVERLGRPVAAWINNAGIVRRHAAEDLPVEVWREIFEVNVTSALLGSQAAFRLMKPRGHGAIVNLSSIMGRRTKENRTAYGTSKAAIEHLTRYLALEFGPHGVRVNAVAPGLVESEMASWANDESLRDEVLAQIPLRRFAQKDDVADAVEMLVSRNSSYITGHVLNVDGGWLS